jgi:hypothetical protein
MVRAAVRALAVTFLARTVLLSRWVDTCFSASLFFSTHPLHPQIQLEAGRRRRNGHTGLTISGAVPIQVCGVHHRRMAASRHTGIQWPHPHVWHRPTLGSGSRRPCHLCCPCRPCHQCHTLSGHRHPRASPAAARPCTVYHLRPFCEARPIFLRRLHLACVHTSRRTPPVGPCHRRTRVKCRPRLTPDLRTAITDRGSQGH